MSSLNVLEFEMSKWLPSHIAHKYYVGVTFASHVIVIIVSPYSYVFYYWSIVSNLNNDYDHQNRNLKEIMIIKRTISKEL